MNTLDINDLKFAVQRLPEALVKIMYRPEWHNRIFIAGGFVRAIVAGEKISDIDLFTDSLRGCELLANNIATTLSKKVHKTDNAFSIRSSPMIQVISRWTFMKPEQVAESFDFTVCCAVIYYNGKTFDSYVDERFYVDLASKRLVYRKPVRNEDAGGSMLRVLKYYQRGYRIPLDSLAAVIARLNTQVDFDKIKRNVNSENSENSVADVITGLLRIVDPTVVQHLEAYLPSMATTNPSDLPPDNLPFYIF